MRERLIIELSNGIKYTIIDAIEYNSNKYFLLTQVSKDETMVSEELEICRYDIKNNNFDQITDIEEYTIIKKLFDERISQEKIELNIKEVIIIFILMNIFILILLIIYIIELLIR